MKKTLKTAVVVLLALCMICPMPVKTLAKEKEYTYTVRFFAGSHGTIDGEEVIEYSNLKYGDRVTFRQNRVTLEKSSKYYIRGIRESGKDNSTVSGTSSFTVTGDQDYVVAYGILGNAVAYTVNYQDAQGNPLAPSETFYGNVGDRPVVAYQYIANYLPQAYQITATLQADASKNVFTFVYTRMSAAAQEAAAGAGGATTTPAGGTAGGAAAGGAAAGGAAAGGAAAGGAAAPAAGPAADAAMDAAADIDGAPEEIQDNDVPLADQQLNDDNVPGSDTTLESGETPVRGGDFARMLLSLPLAAKVGICSAIFLIGGVGGFMLTRKRRKIKYVKDSE